MARGVISSNMPENPEQNSNKQLWRLRRNRRQRWRYRGVQLGRVLAVQRAGRTSWAQE